MLPFGWRSVPGVWVIIWSGECTLRGVKGGSQGGYHLVGGVYHQGSQGWCTGGLHLQRSQGRCTGGSPSTRRSVPSPGESREVHWDSYHLVGEVCPHGSQGKHTGLGSPSDRRSVIPGVSKDVHGEVEVTTWSEECIPG